MKLLKAFGMTVACFLVVILLSWLFIGLLVLLTTLPVWAGFGVCGVAVMATMTWGFYNDL